MEAIGARQARRYFLTGERFTAAEAFRIGLLHDIVPLAELDARVDELLGARASGLRITLGVSEGKGVLAKITESLADLGANIISVVTYAGQDASQRMIMMKLCSSRLAEPKRAVARANSTPTST